MLVIKGMTTAGTLVYFSSPTELALKVAQDMTQKCRPRRACLGYRDGRNPSIRCLQSFALCLFFLFLLPSFLSSYHPHFSSSFLLLQTFWDPRTLTSMKGQRCPHSDCWPSPRGLSGDSDHWLIPENKTTLVQWSLCSTKARSPQRKFWVRKQNSK